MILKASSLETNRMRCHYAPKDIRLTVKLTVLYCRTTSVCQHFHCQQQYNRTMSDEKLEEEETIVKRNEMFLITPAQTYAAGDEVRGIVELHIVNPTVSQSLTVVLKGVEITDFTSRCKEINSFLKKTAILELPNQEEFELHHTINFVVPIGNYRIPFTFALPSYLPPSYRHPQQIAAVEYTLTATLKPAGWNDQALTSSSVKLLGELQAEEIITVTGTLFDAKYLQQVQAMELKATDSKFVASADGPLECIVTIDRKVYQPGEVLHFHLDLQNSSDERVTEMYGKLVQHVEYFSMDKKVMEENFEIGVVNIGTMPPRSEIHQTKGIPIPISTVESIVQKMYLSSCTFGKLVRISYGLVVTIDVNTRPLMTLVIPLFVVRKSIAELLNSQSKPIPVNKSSPQRNAEEHGPANYQEVKTSSGVIMVPREHTVEDGNQKLPQEKEVDSQNSNDAGAPLSQQENTLLVNYTRKKDSSPPKTSQSPRRAPISSPKVSFNTPEKGGQKEALTPRGSSPISRRLSPKTERPMEIPRQSPLQKHHTPSSASSPNNKLLPSPQQQLPNLRTHYSQDQNQSPMHKEFLKRTMDHTPSQSSPVLVETNNYKRSSTPSIEAIENSLSQTKQKILTMSSILEEPDIPMPKSPRQPKTTKAMSPINSPGENVLASQEVQAEPNNESLITPRSGKATFIYPNGSKFSGYWANGQKNGKGKMVYLDSSIYTGEWSNDTRHGWGIYSAQNYTYDGQWDCDIKHGRGLIIYSNGEQYEGEWEGNYPSGRGEYVFKDGSRYIGSFSKGLRHGSGTLYYADGQTIYDGEWVHDKKHGSAKITFVNGVYEGDMMNDVKEGVGVYSYKNGDVYEGSWKDNKKHGVGVYRFAGGRGFYKGTWVNGLKDNIGILEISDGKRFQERWNMGKHISKTRIE